MRNKISCRRDFFFTGCTICDCNSLSQDIQINLKPFSSFHKCLTNFFKKNGLLKEFLVPGKFGGLWYTTWQLCLGNNSNDLGIDLDIGNIHYAHKLNYFP